MKKIFILFVIAFFYYSSLNAQITIRDSIIHDGIYRYYLLYAPVIYNPAKPTPLVFNLHGLTSNSFEQMFYGNFMPIADTANFIIVAPDGTSFLGSQFWNVGIFPSTVDDIGFLTSLIDSLSLQYNIDPNRIYSTGMSNGGFMSYYLACHSNRFAAIASVTGSITISEFSKCSPSHPLPVMEIHGTADSTVPYNGTTLFKPIEDVVNYWVDFNKCNPVPVITDVPDINTKDGATAQHYVYSRGTKGSSVEFFKVINGAHTWPGSAFVTTGTCLDFSACKEIWRFFRSYSLDKLMTIPELVSKENKLLVYPNPSEGNVNIHTTNYDIIDVQIFSLNGDLVLHKQNSRNIEINDLPPNMYFLKIKTVNKIYAEKIIIY